MQLEVEGWTGVRSRCKGREDGGKEGRFLEAHGGAHEQQFHLHRPPPLKMEVLFRFSLVVCCVSDAEPICLPGQNSKDPYVHHAFSCSPSPSLCLFLSLSLSFLRRCQRFVKTCFKEVVEAQILLFLCPFILPYFRLLHSCASLFCPLNPPRLPHSSL